MPYSFNPFTANFDNTGYSLSTLDARYVNESDYITPLRGATKIVAAVDSIDKTRADYFVVHFLSGYGGDFIKVVYLIEIFNLKM